VAAALGLLLAAAAGADPAGAPLAPPGECAQAREALGATQDDDVLAPAALDAGDGFDVAGSPRHHFTPGDVALGAGAPTAPPVPPGFRRDPCDAPLAGCRSILDRGSDVVVEEEGPGTGGGPGSGGQTGGRE
jgi:hypothetical protein